MRTGNAKQSYQDYIYPRTAWRNRIVGCRWACNKRDKCLNNIRYIIGRGEGPALRLARCSRGPPAATRCARAAARAPPRLPAPRARLRPATPCIAGEKGALVACTCIVFKLFFLSSQLGKLCFNVFLYF